MNSICAKCTFLHGEAKRMHWRYWPCTSWPMEPERNWVTGEMEAPYGPCWRKNKNGDCADFSEGRNCLTAKETD